MIFALQNPRLKVFEPSLNPKPAQTIKASSPLPPPKKKSRPGPGGRHQRRPPLGAAGGAAPQRRRAAQGREPRETSHAGTPGATRNPRISDTHMAVGQNQWFHFRVAATPMLVYFSGDWDVHWGYGILTHGHMAVGQHLTGAHQNWWRLDYMFVHPKMGSP